MADHRNKKKPVNDRLWVRVLCGILGILMILGTFVYVLASFQLNAADEVRVNEREIAVGIAYGNDLLPTYTVSTSNGFEVSVSDDRTSKDLIDLKSQTVSVAENNNLHKTSLGYESDDNRVTVIGGYHIQISAYSFRIGADGNVDNPASIFPGGAGSGSIDELGYTLDEVRSKVNDLNESGFLEFYNTYSYPVYVDGKYFIRVGNFDSIEKANEFSTSLSENISMVSKICEPGDGSVSLIDYSTNKVLFSFILSDTSSLKIKPKNENIFYDYTTNQYYGYVNISHYAHGFSVANKIMLEDYVKCILPTTISETNDIELLKLFAVLLRTKVLYNSEFHAQHGIDVCTDDHCSIYYGKKFESDFANSAVDMTCGEIITHNGKAISPVYSISTGSTTASALDVFGKDVRYLNAISNADKDVETWKYCISPGDVYQCLVNAGYTEITSNIATISVISRGNGSVYVNSLLFIDILGNSLTIEGSDAIYKALGYKLPSVAFTVGKSTETVERVSYFEGREYREPITLEGNYGEFVFVGEGIGVGLGLSIQGASEDIDNGKSYKDVISKYYSNVEVVQHP